MLGAVLAMHRNEHLRLTCSWTGCRRAARARPCLRTGGGGGLPDRADRPAIEHAQEEWIVTTPALEMPTRSAGGAIARRRGAMLAVVRVCAAHGVAGRRWSPAPCWWRPSSGCAAGWRRSWQAGLAQHPDLPGRLGRGVPGRRRADRVLLRCRRDELSGFTTQVPLLVIIGRMDEGMSSLVLVSVPIFVLLGCVLDATGMGKAIVDLLASLIGPRQGRHVLRAAGLAVHRLGHLRLQGVRHGDRRARAVPGDAAARQQAAEMVALLATGAAMADTVPPSIVLIVLGSVAGVSIAGLFESGFVVAMVLLLVLLVLARWKARHEDMRGAARAPMRRDRPRCCSWPAPALVLPFLIRSAVGGGVATATEVSTIAVLYAMLIGQVLYGGLGLRKIYGMLVETAALSRRDAAHPGYRLGDGLGHHAERRRAAAVAFLTTLPGGWIAFMAVTIVVFLVLGCLLEGLPAVLLLAPIMFPIAKKLGINDIHYSMVIVCAMNIGLMMPPIGVGFYVACRIGDAKPDDVIGRSGLTSSRCSSACS